MTCPEVMNAVRAAVAQDEVHLSEHVVAHFENCEACRMAVEETIADETANVNQARRALDEAMPAIHQAIDHIAHGVIEGTAVVEDRDEAVKNAKAWFEKRREEKGDR